MRAPHVARWILFAALAGLLVGHASAGDEAVQPSGPEIEEDEPSGGALAADEDLEDEDLLAESGGRDPLEGLNRNVFSFNRRVDRYVFDPITHGYQFVVPAPGRRAIYRAFKNLDSPVILANHMLQFRPVAAATTTTRFVLNSTIGLAGLFDPAASFFKVARLEGDFGQTLARYGTPSGPFLMLPVFGPSTLRDVCGDVVDILADPLSYLLGPYQWWTLLLGGGEGLSAREAHLSDYEALEAGSVDFYSALRSAYLQSRSAMVDESRSETFTKHISTASAF